MNATVPGSPSNVIQLPNALSDIQFHNAQSSIDQVREAKQEMCEEVLVFTLEQTITCLRGFGFLLDSNRVHDKDVALVELALESMLYRYHGMQHKMHEIVETMIGLEDEDEAVEGDGGISAPIETVVEAQEA